MPKYTENRVLGHPPQRMFELVADVERYPEFLPWCLGARITKREETSLDADMLIGFHMIRENFGSHVELDRDNRRIDVRYTHGPFRYLINHWQFLTHSEGCEINFSVDFEFRSRFLQKIMGIVFTEAVHRMVHAFESRAREIYGSPTAGKLYPNPTVPAK